MRSFAELSALLCLFDNRNTESSWVRSLNGRTVSDRLWLNLFRYWHIPRNCCTPALSVGDGISVMVVIFRGSGYTPLSVSLCPTKVTEGDLNWSFFTESQRLWLLNVFNNFVRFLSWSTSASSFVSPNLKMHMSSAMLIVSGRLSRHSCCSRWYASDSGVIPNGIQVYQ